MRLLVVVARLVFTSSVPRTFGSRYFLDLIWGWAFPHTKIKNTLGYRMCQV